MTADQAKGFYKKLALQIHPDKNHHHQAKEAFQKLQESIQACVGMF
jgi:DnaJ-class molecular chaperone